jgi:thiosulfate dehydrogenase
VKLFAGVIVGVLFAAGFAFVYFLSGSAPVAVADKTMPFEKFLANGALHARIEKERPKNVPVAADESTYMAGAKVYAGNCAVCHGLPNTDQGPIAKGMFPKPPRLFHGKGVTDDEPGETYWKVANGIRLTGMPAFKNSLSETEMWQVSLLLANANKISDAVKDQLKPPNSGGPSATPHAPPAKPSQSKAPPSKPKL